MDNLRNTIATKILSTIPPRVKPIDYLMEALDISRESVYRRIRGDISFTLEEIVKLSIDLGFSIDELILNNMQSRVFFDLNSNGIQDASEIFVNTFQQYFQSMIDLPSTGKKTESITALNHPPFGFIVFFEHLFKFSYFRWMHQHQESSLNYFYSDVTLPEKLIYQQHITIENMKKVRNETVIFDPNIFLNLIREIQYYYRRKLINENDFSLIKNDLSGMVDMMEQISQTGFYSSEIRCNLYLSSLNIESNSKYIKSDDQVKSFFFTNLMEPITIINPYLCASHKKWLDSIRKYATLITQSNEILQIRYFNKQRAFINDIEDTMSIFPF